jgi:uncharacterized phage protein gp47/JayE
MANLNTQSATTLIQNFVAAAQGACETLLDFSVGSILLAVAQATRNMALWLQGLILQLLATTRLSTSVGNDVDTFCVDYMPALPGSVTAALPNGSPRLPAVSSTGAVTLARFTPTNSAFIPASIVQGDGLGANIQTGDGTQTFTVVADITQPLFSTALGGYTIPAGQASGSVTVQALAGGTGGNISEGTLTVIQTGINGVDTATNPAPFDNGINQESDPALKARFQAFFGSLSEGTVSAIENAITGLQQNLQAKVIENEDFNGQADNGMITIIVDDGSGDTPTATITSVFNAVNATRAAGIRLGVFAATELLANVVCTIDVLPGFLASTVRSNVQAAISAAIDATGLANNFEYFSIGVAAKAVPGCKGVRSGATLNGGDVDLVPTKKQTIKSGSVTVNLPT